MNIHFIAIGGSAMHNLALALLQKGYQITGSDDTIFEPSNIKWENMQYNSCLRKLRKIFSIFFWKSLSSLSLKIPPSIKLNKKLLDKDFM